jgi:hypothetical protein
VTKIHHDVFICYYFYFAPFDTSPLAGGREEMVSLLEEGLREVTLTSIRLRLRRVTKIHHDVFIFYYFFPHPSIRLRRGGEQLRVRQDSKKLGAGFKERHSTPEN